MKWKRWWNSRIFRNKCKSVRNKLSARNLNKVKTLKGRSLYSYAQIELLTKKVPIKKKPQPEVYYIYESKMNYEG
jgi:hypothetical protein